MKNFIAMGIGLTIGVSFLVIFAVCYCVYFVTIKPIEWAFNRIEVDSNGFY